jgi:hypothetical protein
MDEHEIKSNTWFQRLLCCCCNSKNKREPISGRYDVHKRRQQTTIDRLRSAKSENPHKIDTIRVRHMKFYDETETGSININKNFFD